MFVMPVVMVAARTSRDVRSCSLTDGEEAARVTHVMVALVVLYQLVAEVGDEISYAVN